MSDVSVSRNFVKARCFLWPRFDIDGTLFTPDRKNDTTVLRSIFVSEEVDLPRDETKERAA
ncbi:hypothetical protein V1478_017758 [Vespula squamosa]|uniref:Uncharacterized protein n=1 Tax=Vespula squamosa TaxID=30214 RepID=A0ABD1ZWQ6_VESSQ